MSLVLVLSRRRASFWHGPSLAWTHIRGLPEGACMRSVQVTSLDGPAGVAVGEAPEAAPGGGGGPRGGRPPAAPAGVAGGEAPGPAPGGGEVLVEVRALGVSWPALLLSRGEYQLKPEPPFQLGVDFAGVVRQAPPEAGFRAGDRVAGC